MVYLYSFLFCGLVCLIGQILLDNTKMTPGHITSLFVVIGVVLDSFDIYDKIIDTVGAGALIPIVSFGHSLMHGVMNSIDSKGILGIFSGEFLNTTSGIVAAIVFAFTFSLIFKPKN